MKKRNVILTDTLREISKTRGRFISIALIVALGTGFFCGVKSTCPDMKLTADTYYEETNFSDFHIQGTLGLTESDVKELEKIDGVKRVQPAYSFDVFVPMESNQAIVRLYSIPTDGSYDDENYLNKLILKEGRFPNKKNECVVEKSMKLPLKVSTGNTVSFESGTKDPLSDTLTTNYCNIVGVVESSMYINFERGNSSIGNGEVSSYIYLAEDNFKYDVYTDIYVGLEDSFAYSSFSDEYEQLIETFTDKLEEIGEVRSVIRYQEILDEANEKIDDAQKELDDGRNEANEKLDDAAMKIADAENDLSDGKKTQKKEVAKAQNKLDDARQELIDGQKEYDEEYASYLEEIADAQKEIDDGYEELEKARQEVLDGWQEYYEALAKYQSGKADAREQLSDARKELAQLEQLNQKAQASNVSTLDSFTKGAISSLLNITNRPLTDDDLIEFNKYTVNAKQTLENAEDKADSKLEKGEKQLKEAYQKLIDAEKEIDENEQKLKDAEVELADAIIEAEEEFAKARQEIEDGKIKIEDAQKTLNKEISKSNKEIKDGEIKIADAKEEYENARQEADEKIADAQEELDKARQELADLETPKWYVFDRTSYPGNGDFGTDADRIDKIAGVFPIFFILVAGLICFTTMTRMVEEQRVQIGTLKALGYSDTTIMMKFMLYALVAALVGCVLGMSVGFKIFPYIIFNAYSIMYHFPPIIAPYDVVMIVLATIVSILCTTFAAYIAGKNELKSQPSELMRPKTPKQGKTLSLEKITWLWSKFSFSYKVTIRNLFRYKSRVVLTIIGISGCTALMLAGFGLQYSISSISTRQFEDIFKYKIIAVFQDEMTQENYQNVQDVLDKSNIISCYDFAYNKTIDVDVLGTKRTATLFVPNDAELLPEFITFRDRKTHTPIVLNDEGVVINEKFAKLLNVKVNDTIPIEENGIIKDVVVNGICENYAFNYVYMTPTYYQKMFGQEAEENTLIANFTDYSEENMNRIAEILLEQDEIVGVSDVTEMGEKFKDLMKSLNIIVVVLIICAGALAFIVLYNLTNINVTERIRELATIKVLGFYDKEVSAYIYRENTISAFFGIIFGLLLGIVLHKFIIQTSEVEVVMFDPARGTMSYVYSALLTTLFIWIVNYVLHFKLKAIDMVESLKSVE